MEKEKDSEIPNEVIEAFQTIISEFAENDGLNELLQKSVPRSQYVLAGRSLEEFIDADVETKTDLIERHFAHLISKWREDTVESKMMRSMITSTMIVFRMTTDIHAANEDEEEHFTVQAVIVTAQEYVRQAFRNIGFINYITAKTRS